MFPAKKIMATFGPLLIVSCVFLYAQAPTPVVPPAPPPEIPPVKYLPRRVKCVMYIADGTRRNCWLDATKIVYCMESTRPDGRLILSINLGSETLIIDDPNRKFSQLFIDSASDMLSLNP